MDRDITHKLIKWKDQSDRKSLIIRGARQVGKSYSVMEFGQQYFQGKVHLFDFEKHPEWIQVFERNLLQHLTGMFISGPEKQRAAPQK